MDPDSWSKERPRFQEKDPNNQGREGILQQSREREPDNWNREGPDKWSREGTPVSESGRSPRQTLLSTGGNRGLLSDGGAGLGARSRSRGAELHLALACLDKEVIAEIRPSSNNGH